MSLTLIKMNQLTMMSILDRLIASSRVLDSKSVESSWNFFEKVSSRVEKLNSSTRVELRSLTRQFDSKTRLDSTRY